MTERFIRVSDMPEIVPIFPLRGAILLPRGTLMLNVFEPRYLALVDEALRGDRLIGIIQPAASAGSSESPQGKDFPLREVGCAGKLTTYAEQGDGRLTIGLTGIARFKLQHDVETDAPFRLARVEYRPFAHDFIEGHGEDDVDRPHLLSTLKTYLQAHGLSADWERINSASNERLVNTLSILSPYGPEEKQALLEAPDLRARAEVLVALAEMELAAPDDESGSALQ